MLNKQFDKLIRENSSSPSVIKTMDTDFSNEGPWEYSKGCWGAEICNRNDKTTWMENEEACLCLEAPERRVEKGR